MQKGVPVLGVCGGMTHLIDATLAVHLIRADVDEALDAVHLHTQKGENNDNIRSFTQVDRRRSRKSIRTRARAFGEPRADSE